MNFSISKENLEQNKNDIIDFWKENFPNWPEQKFDWFYLNNPYGIASCWTIRAPESNLIIGATAIFPRKVYANGQYLLAGITGDFGVSKNHRILGPAIQLQKAVISAAQMRKFDFLYGYPNQKSYPVQKRVGFKAVAATIRMVKYLKSYDYVRTHIKLPVVSTILSKPVDLFLKILSRERRQKSRHDLRFEVLASFDERFDHLWKTASRNQTIIGERTSAFLNWRFTECPYQTYKSFTMSERGSNQILGYIVYSASDRVVKITDLLVSDVNSVLDALLSEFLLFQRNEEMKAISIIFLPNNTLVKKLKEYGFSNRKDTRNVVVYADLRSPLSSQLLDQDIWYLNDTDFD